MNSMPPAARPASVRRAFLTCPSLPALFKRRVADRAPTFPGSVGAFVVAALLAGCSPPQSQTIVIRGSNTVGEELAPQLVAEYKKEHPSATFDAEYKGTPYGLGALIVGRCDIAAASRDVSTNELAMARDNGVEFHEDLIGSYAVAVVVNSANPLNSLTRDQVRDLFTGVVKNWKEVGGADAEVHLLIRNPISGTYLGFRELAMENKPYSLSVKAYTNYTDIVQAVAQDPGGIGYASLQLSSKPGVKTVAISGVAPSMAAVREGKYPFARFLRLYTSKSACAPATDFIAFVQSPPGQQILDRMGFVPSK
jgi:phosphate transport system substrate-binding protein